MWIKIQWLNQGKKWQNWLYTSSSPAHIKYSVELLKKIMWKISNYHPFAGLPIKWKKIYSLECSSNSFDVITRSQPEKAVAKPPPPNRTKTILQSIKVVELNFWSKLSLWVYTLYMKNKLIAQKVEKSFNYDRAHHTILALF